MIQQKIVARWNIIIYFIQEKDNLKWSYTCVYSRYTHNKVTRNYQISNIAFNHIKKSYKEKYITWHYRYGFQSSEYAKRSKPG